MITYFNFIISEIRANYDIYIIMLVLVISAIIAIRNEKRFNRNKDDKEHTIKKMMNLYVLQIIACGAYALIFHKIIVYLCPNIIENKILSIISSKIISIPILYLIFCFIFKMTGLPSIRLNDFLSLLQIYVISKANIKWIQRFSIKTITHKTLEEKREKISKKEKYRIVNSKQIIRDGIIYTIIYQYDYEIKHIFLVQVPFTMKIRNLFAKDIYAIENGVYLDLGKKKGQTLKHFEKDIIEYHKKHINRK